MAPIENAQNPEVIWDSVKDYCEDIITVKDINLNYIACNQAFLNLVQKTEDESIGKKTEDIVPSDVAMSIDKKTQELLTKGGSQTFIISFIDKDGIERKIKDTVTLVIKNGIKTGEITTPVTKAIIIPKLMLSIFFL